MNRNRTRRGLLAVALITAAAALASLQDHRVLGVAYAGPGAHGPNGEHLDGSAASASGLMRWPDGSVNIPKLAQRRMEVRTLFAPATQAAVTIELNGRVAVDPNAGGRVQAAHGGRVEPGPRGLPMAGQRVKRGQVLAYLHHHADPFAHAAQTAQLAELRVERQIAEQRVRRLETLEGTTPRKEIDAARAELISLLARENVIDRSLTARTAVIALTDGVLARADVLTGQVVDTGSTLFEIIDPARLLIEASATDPDLANRIAEAHLPGYALRVAGVERVLRDGVLRIYFSAQAHADAPALAVGQPVTVLAQLKERVDGIVLPKAAVVRNGANEPAVWIKVNAERFVAQPVTARPLDADRVVIVRGLAPDNRVVVQGAALVNQIR